MVINASQVGTQFLKRRRTAVQTGQTVRLMSGVMPHNSWASNRGGIASHGETRFDTFGLKRDSEGTYP